MTNTTPVGFNRCSAGHLPGVLGVEIVTITREAVASRMSVKREVMAPNGYLHAASVIARAKALLPVARRQCTSGARPRSGTRWKGRSGHRCPFVLESRSMTHRFFFGFFFYPSQLAEGAG